MIGASAFKTLNRYAPASRAGKLALGVAAAALLAAACALPLAGALGGALVVASPPPARVDFVAPLAGDRALDRAAELVRAGRADAVLLIAPPRNRLDELTPEADPLAVKRRRLLDLGIDASRVRVASPEQGSVEDGWDAAHLLDGLLAGEPKPAILVLADQFGSRSQTMILRRVIPDVRRSRIFMTPLPHRRYGPHDWWRTREGIKALFNAYLEVGFTWIYGETPARPTPWDPDLWERALMEKAKRDPRLTQARTPPAPSSPASNASAF